VSPLILICSGATGGICYWTFSYPFDVVKSSIQFQPDVIPRKYTGTLDCFVKLYKQEGIKAFAKGYGTTIVRCIPAAATTFVVYEYASKLLGA